MRYLRPAFSLFVVSTLLFGVFYPSAATLLLQALFPHQADGSLIEKEGKIVGSSLIGQDFSESKYFWGRLSATSPAPYNAAASSGSNLAPANPALLDKVTSRIEALRKANRENKQPIPVDLVTASASGLDPHISPAAADYQAARVAKARGISQLMVNNLIRQHTEARQWSILGEPRVNVLMLNLALDKLR